jgi:hypothetical protein
LGGGLTARIPAQGTEINNTPEIKIAKDSARKASFSPSIFVRRYLPFFK